MEKIDNILEEFGIESTNVDVPEMEGLSSVFIINKKYVLRSREILMDTESKFRKENKLIEYIRPFVPFRLPKLKKTKKGDFFVIRDGFLWTVYPLIEGRTRYSWQNTGEISLKESRYLMRQLRVLHDKTKGKLSRNIENEKSFLDEVAGKYLKIKHLFSKEVCERIDLALIRIDAVINIVSDDEMCYVHGDFHHGNLLINGDDIGLIDFDWSRIAHPFEDLAFSVMMLMRDYRKDNFKLDEDFIEELIDEYGVERRMVSLFRDYLVLYSFYDYCVFNEGNLKGREYFMRYQREILETLCGKYM